MTVDTKAIEITKDQAVTIGQYLGNERKRMARELGLPEDAYYTTIALADLAQRRKQREQR